MSGPDTLHGYERPAFLMPEIIRRSRLYRGKRVSTTFSLPTDMVEAIDAMARSSGYTRSDIAEDLFEFALREVAKANADSESNAEPHDGGDGSERDDKPGPTKQ